MFRNHKETTKKEVVVVAEVVEEDVDLVTFSQMIGNMAKTADVARAVGVARTADVGVAMTTTKMKGE